jgi:nucleoside-diphosphate-sugar epimerase
VHINIYMKNALLIGTGSRWGLYFTKELISRGYDVTLITSSNPEVNAKIVNIDYFNMTNESLQRIADQVKDKKYDLVFITAAAAQMLNTSNLTVLR